VSTGTSDSGPPTSDTLVSVGLPVRNGAPRLASVVRSVLAQHHERLELVISDNASTDRTEEVCRDLARADGRIVYHRQPQNVGLLNNFVHAIRLARGTFFCWVGDDDWLSPRYVSRCLRAFAEDPRLILVTTQTAYVGPHGVDRGGIYQGAQLGSSDPIARFAEMLRLLNESHLEIDPLYGLMRRAPVAAIHRRNMLREDEVFATRLALAGPWGHVPEVLVRRHWKAERLPALARRLGVPAWQAHVANALQCREILRCLRDVELTPPQRRRAWAAVAAMYLRRQRRDAARRGRHLMRVLAAGAAPGSAPPKL
jgi:glycosyltransferase involved in cell wall biosynthesis